MNHNPLTDPTSLIAYRLANGESSLHARRPTRNAPGKKPSASAAIVGLGLLIAVIIAVARI
jgi:hypothetical protein